MMAVSTGEKGVYYEGSCGNRDCIYSMEAPSLFRMTSPLLSNRKLVFMLSIQYWICIASAFSKVLARDIMRSVMGVSACFRARGC